MLKLEKIPLSVLRALDGGGLLVLFCAAGLAVSWIVVEFLSRALGGRNELLQIILIFLIGFDAAAVYRVWSKRLSSYRERRVGLIDHGERGRVGERLVSEELGRILGGEYQIYKNFHIPGRNFDIDEVVVGPKGIFLIEVKNYTGRMDFYRNYALKSLEGGLYEADEVRLVGKNDPRNQLIYHTAIFEQYLQDLGFERIEVKSALVFVEPIVEEKEASKVKILNGLNLLEDFLTEAENDPRFTAELIGKITTAFAHAWSEE